MHHYESCLSAALLLLGQPKCCGAPCCMKLFESSALQRASPALWVYRPCSHHDHSCYLWHRIIIQILPRLICYVPDHSQFLCSTRKHIDPQCGVAHASSSPELCISNQSGSCCTWYGSVWHACSSPTHALQQQKAMLLPHLPERQHAAGLRGSTQCCAAVVTGVSQVTCQALRPVSRCSVSHCDFIAH